MIRGYQPHRALPPQGKGHIQWLAAVKAGFAAGLVFLFVARGNPWAGLTFSSPVVMGRLIPAGAGIPLTVTWIIHLCVSVLYTILLSLMVTRLSQWRAILAGAVGGLLLYLLNRGIVYFVLPTLAGHEAGVLFTHVVFGMVASGAYRGLLDREPITSGA